jgi:hypothetical protein
VDEQHAEDREAAGVSRVCVVCGTRSRPGDRYCAECGALLPDAEPGVIPLPSLEASPPAPNEDEQTWLFGTRPVAVISGGILLLLLAAVLLAVGQLDDTGTIVMLSICLTPLALLTIAIGIGRLVAGGVRGSTAGHVAQEGESTQISG